MPKKLLMILVFFLFSMGLLEGVSRLSNHLGLVNLNKIKRTEKSPRFWQDLSPHFGVWRYPHSTFRHKKMCFDVVYKSNEFGARDKSRNKSSSLPRVAVLGDSFTEGIGVASESRFTNLLESRSGIEHLNFGTSGNFGSIQQWQLYKNMVKDFRHDLVVIFLLPDNDFLDNRPIKLNRYKPLVKKSDVGYELYYSKEFKKIKAKTLSDGEIYFNHLYNNFYSIKLFTESFGLILNKFSDQKSEYVYMVGYKDYTENDLDILLYTYKQISIEANGKPLILVSIPRHKEFMALEKGERLTLPNRLRQFADQNEKIYFLDLLPHFLNQLNKEDKHYNSLFHTCDGHWNANGHKLAAETFYKFAKKEISEIYFKTSEK